MSEAKRLWTNRDYNDVRATLIAPCGVVFIGDEIDTPNVVCIDVDGGERWKVHLPGFSGGTRALALSPDGSTLYVGSDGRVDAMEIATGKPVWRTPDNLHPIVLTAQTSTEPESPLILTTELLHLQALDRSTGHERWRVNGDAPDALLIRGRTVLTYSEHDVQAYDLMTGKQRWQFALAGKHAEALRGLRSSVNFTPAPDGMAYFVDINSIGALDLQTGKLLWRHPTTGYASFAGTRDAIVLADESGYFGLDPRTGKVRWQHATPGKKLAAPLTATEDVVNLPHSIACVDLLTGDTRSLVSRDFVDTSADVLAVADGRVLMLHMAHAQLLTLKHGKLILTDITDHRFSGARVDDAPVGGVFAKDMLVTSSKNNSIQLLQIP